MLEYVGARNNCSRPACHGQGSWGEEERKTDPWPSNRLATDEKKKGIDEFLSGQRYSHHGLQGEIDVVTCRLGYWENEKRRRVTR